MEIFRSPFEFHQRDPDEPHNEFLGTNKPVNGVHPLVSVTVVAYNHSAYIRECLDSILMQRTSFPFEIILGEDGSEDGTRELCIQYAKAHTDKIRLFLRDRTKSVYYLNQRPHYYNGTWGRRAARGRYIAICDGDDYWTDPLKLQKQVDLMEKHQDLAICCHQVYVKNELAFPLNETGPNVTSSVTEARHWRVTESERKEGIYVLDDFLRHNFLPTASVVFRNCVPSYPHWYFRCWNKDVPLLLLVLTRSQYGRILFLKQPMAVYRRHKGGLYAGSGLSALQQSIATRLLIEKELGLKSAAWRQGLLAWYRKLLRQQVRERKWGAALVTLARAKAYRLRHLDWFPRKLRIASH